MSYKEAYQNNHIDFKINNITYEDDARVSQQQRNSGEITFSYRAPAVTVDTAARFAKHEIIGGSTVRQKIGEEPIEVVVDGVVREPVARQLDSLRDAKFGDIYSNRLTAESLTVHFASVSTQPLKESGAVAISDDDGEFLYSFTLSAVEVTV